MNKIGGDTHKIIERTENKKELNAFEHGRARVNNQGVVKNYQAGKRGGQPCALGYRINNPVKKYHAERHHHHRRPAKAFVGHGGWRVVAG